MAFHSRKGATVHSSRIFFNCSIAASLLLATGASHAQRYWRIDTGVSASSNAEIRDKDFGSPHTVICGDAACNAAGNLDQLGNSAILGLGAGYRLNSSMRADVTLGYRPNYRLNDADQKNPPAHFKARVSSLSVLMNGYYEFGLTDSTAYVGAGIGLAQNKIDRISIESNFVGGRQANALGGTKTGFTFAVMAGFGIPLSRQLTLDVGYRYIDLGKIETAAGTFNITSPVTASVSNFSGFEGKLRAQELTLGLRF
jgi:opacity protein-like surface antigen